MKSHHIKNWILGLLLLILTASICMALLLAFTILNLPKLSGIQDYSPQLVSRVLARDGRLMGEFYNIEKRYLLPIDEIPELAIKAFVSAEDDRFFEHGGVDFRGITRAFFANLKAGKVVQGGSTITQQVAKSLLLSPERSFSRKFKEVLLAHKIESNFNKKQILY